MLPLLLAQTASENASLWLVVIGLGVLASLGVNAMQLIRTAGGKESERQIEPTALHAITNELKSQTATLNKLDREMGGFVAQTAATQREIDALRENVNGVHVRIGGISRDLAATAARVDGLEKREGNV